MGRRPRNRTLQINVALSAAERAELDALAAELNLSMSDAIRYAVRAVSRSRSATPTGPLCSTPEEYRAALADRTVAEGTVAGFKVAG